MAKINRDAAQSGGTQPPDIYLAEVKDAQETTTKRGGYPMLVVDFVTTDEDRANLFRDWIVTDGPGAVIGVPKLDAMGFGDREDVTAAELIGKKVWVKLVESERDGRVNLKCDPSGWDDAWGGYRPEEDVPPEARSGGTSNGTADDVPF